MQTKNEIDDGLKFELDFKYDNNLVQRIEDGDKLIKHTAAIHVENNLSILDRKISNILIKNAFNTLLTAEYHIVKISDIKELIGWKTMNDSEIKASLERLACSKVKWNILNKDNKNKTEWVVSTMLASANYKKYSGFCEYSYSYHLRHLLARPNLYAKIDLLVQKNFKNKYALVIWEFIMESLCVSKRLEDFVSHYTDFIKLEDFRRLLSIEGDTYQEFKFLNRHVIKGAINEINEITDFNVEVDFRKINRAVSDIRFLITKNSTAIKLDKKFAIMEKARNVNKIEEESGMLNFSNNENVASGDVLSEEELQVFERLVAVYKIAHKRAKALIKDFGDQKVKAAIAYSQKCFKTQEVKNKAAFIVKAIQDGYGDQEEVSSLIAKKWDLEKNIKDIESVLSGPRKEFEDKILNQALELVKAEISNFEELPQDERKSICDVKFNYLMSSNDIEEVFLSFLDTIQGGIRGTYLLGVEKIKATRMKIIEIEKKLRN